MPSSPDECTATPSWKVSQTAAAFTHARIPPQNVVKAAAVCETFQLGVAVHSSGELGIQLATMLHLGAVIPNLAFAADAHYHHLTDDIIEGGKFSYHDGAIAVPSSPGLGVRLDRDKLAEYEELYRRLGPYPYDQDPLRPRWTPIIPNDRWADPDDARQPANISL